MKKPQKTMVLTIKLCIFMLACFSYNNLFAQAIDMLKLTPDERKATQTKIEAASRVDWQNTMDMFKKLQEAVIGLMLNINDCAQPENITGWQSTS